MERQIDTQETPEALKRQWKTPVLHTRSVEETLSGGAGGSTEDDLYSPGAIS